MKNLLSIGEVSKIKGISQKSLRYYDQIGILIPAYVNPDTNYRYYSIEQLLIIDLIQICIELEIPLKDFHKYITEEKNVDIQKLLLDGENIVNQKIKKLNYRKEFLSNVYSHTVRTNKIKNEKEFIEYIPKRYLLTIDYNYDFFDYKKITSMYSKLFKQALDLKIPDNFTQGFLVEKNASKIFLDIPKPNINIENLTIIEEGNFKCKILPFEEFSKSNSSKNFFIVKEIFDLTINPHNRFVEVQEPITKIKET